MLKSFRLKRINPDMTIKKAYNSDHFVMGKGGFLTPLMEFGEALMNVPKIGSDESPAAFQARFIETFETKLQNLEDFDDIASFVLPQNFFLAWQKTLDSLSQMEAEQFVQEYSDSSASLKLEKLFSTNLNVEN